LQDRSISWIKFTTSPIQISGDIGELDLAYSIDHTQVSLGSWDFAPIFPTWLVQASAHSSSSAAAVQRTGYKNFTKKMKETYCNWSAPVINYLVAHLYGFISVLIMSKKFLRSHGFLFFALLL